VRFRDIKKNEELLKLHGHSLPDPEAVKLDAELRAARLLRKQQERYERKRLQFPPPGRLPQPPEGGCKRGPKPDPTRDKCEHGVHTQLTRRELSMFEQLRRQFGAQLTRSSFLRFVVCEFLETHRRKDCPTTPFTVDLRSVDYRCLRGLPRGKERSRSDRPTPVILYNFKHCPPLA